MFRKLLDAFWSEHVWLPPNTTWEDLTPGLDKAVVYTDYRHLLYSIPLSLLIIGIRHLLEKYCFKPFGKSLGIKNTRPKQAPYNPKLEAAYQKAPKIKHKKILALSKQLELSERQVERWWRLRHSQDKPSTLDKFSESMWGVAFYTSIFSYGLFILWDKEWFWDIDHSYIGYPHHGITNDIWWYYVISLAFYLGLIITQFWDVRRKDFWLMFVHHLVTIFLMSFSWLCNYHRIGTLILLCHDCAEIPLNSSKAVKYAGYHKLLTTLFCIFIASWIVTRVGIFPFYIFWSVHFSPYVASYITIALLYLLLGLNLSWTWLLIQMVYKIIKTGKLPRHDIRSSSSEIDSSAHNSNHSTPNHVNHDKDM